jgi:hypothetical protein
MQETPIVLTMKGLLKKPLSFLPFMEIYKFPFGAS